MEDSLVGKRPRLEESDVVVPFVVQPKIKNMAISDDASVIKDPAVALSLATSISNKQKREYRIHTRRADWARTQ